MTEIFMTLIIVLLMLIAACFIGSLVLAKDTKDFHISFGYKGFEMTGSFFEHKKSQENQ